MVPARTQPVTTFEVFLTQLREAHELSVYEAIERLVQSAEEAGFDSDTLLRLLARGMTFEQLLELIESKMTCSQAVA